MRGHSRLLLLLPSLAGGGAERVASTLLPCLDRDFDVILALLEDRRTYPVPAKIRVQAFSGPLRSQRAHLVRIPFHLVSLIRLVRCSRSDIVLSFMEQANILNLLAAIFTGHRAIISQRVVPRQQYANKGMLGRIIMQISRWFYPRANHIITVSAGIREILLEEYDIEPNQVTIIPNPINCVAFADQAKECPDFPIPDNFILHVGRMKLAHKAQDVLLDAFYIFHQTYPDFKLILVGDGPDRRWVENRVRTLGLADFVQIVGWQNNVAIFMARAQVLVLSSRYEGWPNVLLEAMSVGCPVVATDCPSGPKEILCDNKFGVLVPIDDPENLAVAMEKLMLDESSRANYQQQARIRSQDFSLEKIGAKYVDLLISVLECR